MKTTEYVPFGMQRSNLVVYVVVPEVIFPYVMFDVVSLANNVVFVPKDELRNALLSTEPSHVSM
jgi:hypothetical protein